MSKEKRKSARADLLRSVGLDMGRELSARTLLFHQAVADQLNLGVVDLKCMDYLSRGEPVTAGELAALTGLTTGAITGVIDRLEKRGFVRRERTPDDRRKVIVRPVAPKDLPAALKAYESLGNAMTSLAEKYSTEELELIADFSQRCIDILKRETQKLGE